MDFVTDGDIKAKEAELSALKAKKMAQDSKPLADLAVRLHDAFCTYNHTDGCAWGYETTNSGIFHDWGGQAHQRWMERTERVIKRLGDRPLGEQIATKGWSAMVPEVMMAFFNVMKETN
jgi:hypothetical protein